MIRDAEQANSDKQSDNTSVSNETDADIIVKLEPTDADEEIVKTEIDHSEITDFTLEQMKQEPIVIKDEPMESDDEGISDGKTTENNKPTISKKRKSVEKNPEVVKPIPNKCFICDTIYKSKDEFNAHLGIHSDMLPYKCTQCSTETNPVIYTTLPLLNRHFETHGFNYICPYCPLKHRRMESLVNHLRIIHKEKQRKAVYICEFCGKEFISVYAFRTHIATHRNITAELYKCESCQKCFPARFSLLRHQSVFACEKAEKTHEIVKTKSNLMKKTDDIGVKNNESNKCFICDMFLLSKQELKDHLKSHRSMLPYKCPLCSTDENNFKISYLSVLNKHFERHGYQYACPKCPLPYPTKKALKFHILNVHEVEKKEYVCGTCGKAYINSYHYQKHVDGHRNIMTQKFVCEFCQMNFSSMSELYKHQKVIECMSKIGKEAEPPKSMENIAAATLMENDNNVESNETDKLENTTKTEPSETSPNSLGDEEKVVNTASNKCYICDTIPENDFDEHLKSHENLLPYECSRCVSHTDPIIISNMTVLNEHFDKLFYTFICPHSPSRYMLGSKLAHHMQSMHGKKKVGHTCETCGKVYRRRAAYRAHRTGHQNLIKQRFKCEPCQKIFPWRDTYIRHKASFTCLRQTEIMSRVGTTKCQSSPSEGSSKGRNNQRSSNGLDHNDAEGKKAFIQSQIETESIDIKDEPLDSDEVIDDDEMTHS